MTDHPAKRRKIQPTADEFRATIAQQEREIESLQSYGRIQRRCIEKQRKEIADLRGTFCAKVAAFFRSLRSTNQDHKEPTP